MRNLNRTNDFTFGSTPIAAHNNLVSSPGFKTAYEATEDQ